MSAEFLNRLFSLEGQVVVVIGGTGVLGGALADGIAGAGALVVVAGRNEEQGRERVAQIESQGFRAAYLEVDVFSRESIEALLASVVAKHGRVDALVNCAGVNHAAEYLEVGDAEWDRVIAVNLRATHVASQAFARHWVSAGQSGAILNIGSVSAGIPLSRVFAYSASKAAVVNLTKNLARELAPKNIRVNVLCPGFFPAEQNRKILTAERVAKIMEHSPSKRFGEPPELVGAALLLLAPVAGSFITGAELYVDGGFTAMTI